MDEHMWRKSSRSGTGGDGGQDCVEVADLGGTRAIRDSKAPHTGHLVLTTATFTGLITRIKRSEPAA